MCLTYVTAVSDVTIQRPSLKSDQTLKLNLILLTTNSQDILTIIKVSSYCGLLGDGNVWICIWASAFRRNTLVSSSEYKINPEDRGSMFLRNVETHLSVYTVITSKTRDEPSQP
jgi:hypothetical protein